VAVAQGARAASGDAGPELDGITSIEAVSKRLAEVGYIPDRRIAVAAFLSLSAGRPLLLEGPAGVGKTELAKALARMLGRDLIRLQCYEGIDASQALYEWDFSRQLLYAQAIQKRELGDDARLHALYGPEFLSERPLLQAVRAGSDALLLIDEVDRSDHEFEAFLLQFLGEYSVTIPELGTLVADSPPIVILTSNRTRELHDALTRRCMYCWIDLPDVGREMAIIRHHVPEASDALARSVAETVARLRTLDLVKPPGSAEAIDWCRGLALLGATDLHQDLDLANESLGWVIKNHDDLRRVAPALTQTLRATGDA
jgi:MoxR-like ATPase